MGLYVELYTRERPRDGRGYPTQASSVGLAILEAKQEAERNGDFATEILPKVGVIVENESGILRRHEPRL